MKNYQVSPISEGFSSVKNRLMLKTSKKEEALKYAKQLKKNFKEVAFNTDTYINGECVKNEFAYFENEANINVYSIVDYRKKKKIQPLINKPNQFFNEI